MANFEVLNLIINGIPSIPYSERDVVEIEVEVLNLIINGIPSIQEIKKGYEVAKAF